MDKFHTHARYQYVSANIVCLGTFITGLINGWTSSAVPILQSADTPLKAGGITADQLSWIASISNIGGFLGTFLFGYLADKFGRRNMLCITPIPSFISFFMIIYADNVYELYVSRFLGGVAGGGSYVIAPLYIIEISECKIRGYLTSKIQLFYNIGIFFAFVIGNFCPYQITAIIFCCTPVIYGIATLFLRETPFYLIRHDKIDEAVKSFQYFRCIEEPEPFTSERFQIELNEIKTHKDDLSVKFGLKLHDFINYTSVKAQSLGILLATLNQLSGCTAMISYATSVFQVSGSNYSPKISSIVIGLIAVIGTTIATSLVEHIGRKRLIISSSVGCAVVLTVFGVSNLLSMKGHHVADILPVLCFGAHIFISCCGPLNLPYVIIPEIMPHKIRSITLSYINAFIWILSFVCVKFFYIVAFTYGLYICLFFFAAYILFTSLILLFVLPETKGKRISEIQCCLSTNVDFSCVRM